MKCPECSNELKQFWNIPFVRECKECQINWVIQTVEQSTEMGKLNTELLSRNDLSTTEKVNMILKKSKELDTRI